MLIPREVVALSPSHLGKGSLPKASKGATAESTTSVAPEAVSVAAVVTTTVVVAGITVVSPVGAVVSVIGIATVAGAVVITVVTIVVATVAISIIIAVVVVIPIAIVSVSVVVAIVAVVITTITSIWSCGGIRLASKRNSRRLLRKRRSHNCVAQESLNRRPVLLCVVGACVLVGLDGIREVGLVLCNLVLDILQRLCGCDLLRAVGLFIRVDLLDCETTTKGTSKGVVAAADGANIAG